MGIERNEFTNNADQCGVDASAAVTSHAKRPAESEVIGRQQEEPWDIGRLQRSCKAGHHAVAAAGADELPQRCHIHAIEQPARAFVGGVEHRAREAAAGHHLHEIIVCSAIGKHDTDDLGRARGGRQRPHARLPLGAREQSDLDVIDPGPRHGLDRCDNHLRFHRQIARHRAHRPPAVDRRDRCAHHIRSQRSQRAVRRILQVDDVGAMREHERGLVRSGHARQQQSHRCPPLP